MGNAFSKETMFIKEITGLPRERGIRVKKKDLIKFFCFDDSLTTSDPVNTNK